ncbi:site-specific integrase [Bdellovibrionota bacterium FG-1]
MAIKTWEEDGKLHYSVRAVAKVVTDREYCADRRDTGVLEERDPEVVKKHLDRIYSRLMSEAKSDAIERSHLGCTWGELVQKWTKALEEEAKWPEIDGLRKPVKWSTARGYLQSVNDFTQTWWKKPASEITPADVEDVFLDMKRLGYSNCRMYNAKVAISKCFKWGMARRMIRGLAVPPTQGFGISRKESKRPEILNVSQSEFLISEGYRRGSPWRQVWKGAYHSGGRSGELFQLKRKHVDLVERMIHFEEKWNFVYKQVEDLKDGEWRHVPINDDLYDLLMELGAKDMGPEDYIFPRVTAWVYGSAAEPLRKFCDEIGVPSICFHTLRACWATQLLKNGVSSTKVMAMGGWSDPETMHRYVRLSGIELDGATDSLSTGPKERPARVLKLVPGSEARKATAAAPALDLMDRLLSSDPAVAEAAKLELEETRRRKAQGA